MKNFIRILSLMFVCVMVFSCFVACKKDEEQPSGDSVSTSVETENPYDENGYLKDSLPATYDWGGKDFVIFSWDNQKSWEWCESLSTESTSVDKLMFERQKRVEERFNVKLKFEFRAGEWDNRDSFITELMNSILPGDKAYDMVGQYTPCAGMGTAYGLYQDLNKVPYLDFSKPWWPTKLVDTATVGTKLYFATGDITVTLMRNVHCMFVNLDLYESYNLASAVGGKSIFQLVDDHEWTMENMLKLAVDKVSVEEGYYGLTLSSDVTADSYFYGGGFISLENVNGKLSLASCLTDQSLSDYFDIVQDMFTGHYDDIALCSKDKNAKKAFEQNKALFDTSSISGSSTYTKKGVKFSILPMPLLNADRESYSTSYSMWVTKYSIPIDVKDNSMSGMIMEGLASDSYRNISDEIYYDHFQIRYNSAADVDSARMFDIVSDSVVFDTARMFMTEIKIFSKFRSGVNSIDQNWTSIYEGNKEGWETSLTTLTNKINDFTK